MPAAYFLGFRPRLVLAQHPDNLLLAKATSLPRPSPFQATDSTSFRLSFRGAGQASLNPIWLSSAPLELGLISLTRKPHYRGLSDGSQSGTVCVFGLADHTRTYS